VATDERGPRVSDSSVRLSWGAVWQHWLDCAWAESGSGPVGSVGGPRRYEKGFPIILIPIKHQIQI
jgi:hypothetical protein